MLSRTMCYQTEKLGIKIVKHEEPKLPPLNHNSLPLCCAFIWKKKEYEANYKWLNVKSVVLNLVG